MRLLLTGPASLLSGRLSAALEDRHEVQVFDRDPCDSEAAARATAGIDAVICALPQTDPADPLPALLEASAGIYNLVTSASAATRFILLSSLDQFERYPLDFRVTEYWAPRPTAQPADLVAFTAEGLLREVSHALPIKVICLRLGRVVDGTGAPDARAVHVQDAIQAVRRALAFEPEPYESPEGWWVFHIIGAGHTRFPPGLAVQKAGYPNGGRGSALAYRPTHDVATGAEWLPIKPEAPLQLADRPRGVPRRIVIFGAGGPFGAAAAGVLCADHVLRLTDARPYGEIVATARPQQAGAPVPIEYSSPHETCVADVTDYAQVLEACQEMDAILNLAVVRNDPLSAFRVNVLGVYNVVRAAVACGIRRVVLTGPNQVFDTMRGGYWPDFHLGSGVPQRPGTALYMLSKFIGQEIARVFAAEHGLEVPVLVYGYFADPDEPVADRLGGHPFTVSWTDVGTSMRAALRAPSFPDSFEVFHILGDLPHGKYRNDRAKQVLSWEPRDRLDFLWRRRP